MPNGMKHMCEKSEQICEGQGRTPGQWCVWSDANGVYQVGPSINLKVASMWHPPLGKAAANARLIAAAPDLLSAVRVAEQLASIATDWNLDEVEIDGQMVSTYDLLKSFQDVVAKAEGRS